MFENEEPEEDEEVNEEAVDDLEETGSTPNFVDNSEKEHLLNYKKISAALKVYEDEYSECIKEIDNAGYNEAAIQACTGENFIKIIVDIKYENMRIISKADTRIRSFMVDQCYK